jgi:hypothetical protein
VISAATFGRSDSSPVNGAGALGHRAASSRRVSIERQVLANSLTERFNGKFRKLFA